MNLNKIPILEIDLEFIQPTPGNRDKIDVNELALSMREHGLLQPILVKADPVKADVYWLIAGERRLKAAQQINWETIPARVLPGNVDEEELAALRLVENLQRVDLTPWEEAAQLEHLRAKSGSNVAILADTVGKSATWVAQRLAIGRLSAPLKKLVIDQDWPLSHLPVLARVPAEMHQEVLERINEEQDNDWDDRWNHRDNGKNIKTAPSLVVLKDLLDDMQQQLSAARWKLDDTKLLPEAGACKTCPKRLSAQAMLFPEVKDTKKDRCLDMRCWEKKEAAFVMLQVGKLKDKKPILVKDYREVAPLVKEKLGPEAVVVESHTLIDCKQSDKGAVPAVLVSGSELGKTVWVKEKPRSGGTMSSRKNVDQVTGKAKPRSPKERLLTLEQKRLCRMVEIWAEMLEGLAVAFRPVVGLVSVFGTHHRFMHREGTSQLWKDADNATALTESQMAKVLWEQVVPVFKERLKRFGPMESQARGLYAEACSQAIAIDQQDALRGCWSQALAEVKFPKSLAKEGVTDPHADGSLPEQETKPKKKGKGVA